MESKESNDGQCQFYLARKRRLCRFRPKSGEKYCPEHACILGIQSGRKRIPCPLNPKHNCYEDELEKHLKKCNVTKAQQAAEMTKYYVRGINRESKQDQSEEESEKTLLSQKCVKALTSTELAAMISKVKKLYADHVNVIETAIYEHPCVREEFCQSEEEDLSQMFQGQGALRKELLQQASLVGQLEKQGLLKASHCFVEMGAGKGKLSHWILKASKENSSNSFLLVDRSSVRYKMDSLHKYDDKEASRFKRIRIDIEDLCLGRVPEVSSADSVVVIGKHLCGGATDMGIRCAMETLETQGEYSQPEHSIVTVGKQCQTATTESTKVCEQLDSCPQGTTMTQVKSTSVGIGDAEQISPTSKPVESMIGARRKETLDTKEDLQEPAAKALKLTPNENENDQIKRSPECIMIALCCHHRCTWDTYLGKNFMQNCGVTPREFDLLTRLSSWATCAKVTAKSMRKNLNDVEDSQSSSASASEEPTLKEKGPKANVADDDIAENHDTEDLVDMKQCQNLREQLNVADREDIGRKCKRILDAGRLHYLRSKGMECCLREYISEDVTPENIVLMAWKHSS